jgi:hypothetical protein
MFRRGANRSVTSLLADRIKKLAAAPAPRATSLERARVGAFDREPTFAFGAVESSCGVREGVVVRDINTSGARIDFTRALELPSRVLLVAPGIGLRRWAEVVWRDSRSAGLKFEARR